MKRAPSSTRVRHEAAAARDALLLPSTPRSGRSQDRRLRRRPRQSPPNGVQPYTSSPVRATRPPPGVAAVHHLEVPLPNGSCRGLRRLVLVVVIIKGSSANMTAAGRPTSPRGRGAAWSPPGLCSIRCASERRGPQRRASRRRQRRLRGNTSPDTPTESFARCDPRRS